jgi:hypothetical protein
MDVGRSSRTPVKHWLLNAHLGQIAGVLHREYTPAKACPFVCIDLCAGDGHTTDDHESSPTIIAKHMRWLTLRNVRCRAVFIEKAANTCEILRRNLIATGGGFEYEVLDSDAREFVFNAVASDQAVFINCDPNSVADMPLTSSLSKSFTKFTTMTVTLGCNASGIKRLPREDREKWGDYVRNIVGPMPSWHDAILVSLNRDGAQWAYITRLPKAWAAKESGRIEKKGNSLWPNGVEVARYREQRSQFDAMLSRLFYTKKELAQ